LETAKGQKLLQDSGNSKRQHYEDTIAIFVLFARYTKLATEPIKTKVLITFKAGKAVLRQDMVIILHPPISTFGIDKAKILAKNIPIVRPNCICGLTKNI
jgi:hypothetical protein